MFESGERSLKVLVALGAALLLESCAGPEPWNQNFPLAFDEAHEQAATMEAQPVPLSRPLVVLAGYLDPGFGSSWTAWTLEDLVGDTRTLPVSFFWCASFAGCREKLIDSVDAAFPSDDPCWTTEVDVVALSMGGLVARDAAAPPTTPGRERRLKIARLFTIGSPHRGARLAATPCFLALHRDMRKESAFVKRLAEAYTESDFELFPYARLGDGMVGAENTAPEGESPLWVSNPAFSLAHLGSATDERILVDIALRLRGEEAYSRRDPSTGERAPKQEITRSPESGDAF